MLICINKKKEHYKIADFTLKYFLKAVENYLNMKDNMMDNQYMSINLKKYSV